jgi:DNA-binding MarR family transcriptional regulator
MIKSTFSQLADGDISKITTYQAGVMQSATHRILQKHCDEVLRPYGITKTQWLIIGTVLDAGSKGIRITDLAIQVGTTLSYLTNTVNLLESKKILRRVAHDSDNRAKSVSIHKPYVKTCQEIEGFLREALRTSIYANISPEDFRVYMKVMYQLARLEK